jgi:eukaryotic-like serine/threonine-protein kinase
MSTSSMTPESCPDEESLAALLEGRLDSQSRRGYENHIDRCRDCALVIADLLARWSERTGSWRSPGLAGSATAVDGHVKLVEGQRVGRFLVLGSAGSGGMATVYAAYDTTLDRKIALKFPSRTGTDNVTKARLLAEASAMAKLSHPNVVTVHDVGVFENEPYLAMEFVEGATLATWSAETPRSAREIVTVVAGAARGLAAAHASGIIHRDVKPQNILVADDRVLVTDFGLSVPATAAGGGRLAGTPGYMAPEQFEGGAIDQRTDVFGLCATLYHLLHGVMPFQGATLLEIRARVLAGEITPRPTGSKAPPWLHRLAVRGMSVRPADRPADVTVVERALVDNPVRRRRRFMAAAAGVAVVGASLWGGGLLRASPERLCLAGARVLDGVWNDGRRAQLRQAYARAGKGNAWPVLERRLDEQAQTWRAMHAATCSATFRDRRQSEQVLDLRMHCLDVRRSALDAFVAALPSASGEQLVRAAGAQLPAAGECDLSGRSLTKPLPADAGARTRIARVESDLGKAEADLALGNYPKAARSATDVVAAARAVGYEPLLARALVLAGTAQGRRGGLEDIALGAREGARGEAVARLEEALTVAERGGDDGARAMAARELVRVHRDADRLREAQTWAELASAVVARLGEPVLERAALELNIGWLKLSADKQQEATAAFRRSLELRTKALGTRHPDTAVSLIASCEGRTTPRETLVCQKQAVAMAEAALGPEHPQVALIYSNMWTPAMMDDPRNVKEGCAFLEKARKILEASVERNNPNLVRTLTDLAYCLRQSVNMERARATFEEALTRATVPSRSRAHLYQEYGVFLGETGNLKESARYVRMAIDDREALFGATHQSTLNGWITLSEVFRTDQRPADALAAMNVIIPRCERAPTPPRQLPDLLTQRGEALRALGRNQEAIAAHTAAVRMHERVGRAPEDRQYAYYGIGAAHLTLGNRDQAIANLEQSLQMIPRGTVRPARWAEAAFPLAAVLGDKAGTRGRACELAAQVLEDFQRDGAQLDSQIKETRALIASLRCPRGGSASAGQASRPM